MAVAAGFEPARGVTPYTLSRRAPSSARAGHRVECIEATLRDRPQLTEAMRRLIRPAYAAAPLPVR
jgi:hypothetical protein